MSDSFDTWVVIPAYNEARVIASVLSSLQSRSYHIVVVDDGSSDATVQEALRFPVTVLRHICNLGQGAALQTGITYALGFPDTRFIVTFDSDGQHAPEDISRLLAPLRDGTHEIALGSRFLRADDAMDVPVTRRITLWLAILLSKLTTGLNLTDTHNGFRAFTADAARKIQISQNRMAHASEILSQIAAHHLRYCEVPVKIAYTQYSRTKGQSFSGGINILWDLVRGNMR
jgi:polyprenyl-phospho-N-acetylgalactosaminyl synthase